MSTTTSSNPTSDWLATLMAERRSCRGFRPDPVPDDVMEWLVATAQTAPSWCNTQPWRVYITTPDATRRLAHQLQARVPSGPPSPDVPGPRQYPGVLNDRRVAAARQLHRTVGIPDDDRDRRKQETFRNFALFDAPHTAIITTPRALGTYGAVDCGVFLSHLLLAGHAAGLGMVPQGAVAMYADTVRQFLDLPDSEDVLVAVSFGYPDQTHPTWRVATDRASVGEALTVVS